MKNLEFLNIIACSFKKFLNTNSRSNEKLKILHSAISNDLQKYLGSKYIINSLNFENSKEDKIIGRYIEKKMIFLFQKKIK